MSETIKTNQLSDADLHKIKIAIYYLNEVIEMMEWSIDKTGNTPHLWIADLQPKVDELLNSFPSIK